MSVKRRDDYRERGVCLGGWELRVQDRFEALRVLGAQSGNPVMLMYQKVFPIDPLLQDCHPDVTKCVPSLSEILVDRSRAALAEGLPVA